MTLEKKFPVHQFMDRETLDWIKDTGLTKGLLISPHIVLSKTIINFLSFSHPKKDFFIDDEMYTGIHGFRHCARVALLCGVVSQEVKITDSTLILAAMIAGSLHDCQRVNDNADEGHGLRSAVWFRENVSMINTHYNIKLTLSEIELIDAAIRFHETDQHTVEANVNPEYWQIINIIKTADALDRYRQPKEKWWIDEDYLRIKPSKALKEVAFNLMFKLEDYHLKTNDNLVAYEQIKKELRYV
jgi:HD superfamily phosphodiesterase